MLQTNQPFLTEIEAALTNEAFIADLKVFFSSGWRIIKVISHVIYLILGQLYVWAGNIRRFADAKVKPVNLKLYQLCSEKKHPVAQFIAGLLKQELTKTVEVTLNGNTIQPNSIRLKMEPQSQPKTQPTN